MQRAQILLVRSLRHEFAFGCPTGPPNAENAGAASVSLDDPGAQGTLDSKQAKPLASDQMAWDSVHVLLSANSSIGRIYHHVLRSLRLVPLAAALLIHHASVVDRDAVRRHGLYHRADHG